MLVDRQRVPRFHARIPGCQLSALRDDSYVDLTLEPSLSNNVPTLVERAPVLRQVLGWSLVGSVGGTEGQVCKEWAVGSDSLAVRHHPQQLVDQVLTEVIAVLSLAGWLDRVVVADQLGMELIGFTLEKSVEPVKSAPQRPLLERPGCRTLFHGGQVPLAGAEGRVTLSLEYLGDRGGMVRDVAQLVGKSGLEVGHCSHTDRMLRPAGKQRGPGWRTKRSHVEVRELKAARRQLINMWSIDF